MFMDIKLMENMVTGEEIEAVISCLKSGQYTQGKLVDSLEKKFAAWNGSKYGVMVNSGSSANLLMVLMLKQKYGLRDGEEVIVPAVTWPTTVYPVLQNNLVPVFCDVDSSFNLDINSIKRMVSNKTKAIFLVHLLGQPANLNEIKQFCDEKKIILIEDCCESTGAKHNGIKVGNFGVMGSFSFYFGHHMTTIEGGMVVTDDFEAYDLLKSARSHGWVKGSSRTELYPEFENKEFLFDMEGYNLRSTNINAAIGLVQLDKLDGWISQRVKNHCYFLQRAKEMGLKCQEVNLDETSSFSFAIIFNTKEDREHILKNLGSHGVESRPVVAGNLLRQPVFKSKAIKADKTPQADLIHEQGIYLPNNQFMNEEKIDYMLDSIKELVQEFNGKN